MIERRRVGISECLVARGPSVLITYGLGSCLGIALYDPKQRLGGLAHSLLPSPPRGAKRVKETKFVETAIRHMTDELTVLGAEREDMIAKIVGGANMFHLLHTRPEDGVGARNVRKARELLESLGIFLAAEDTGGDYGRTVEFDLATGEVRVRTVRSDDLLL